MKAFLSVVILAGAACGGYFGYQAYFAKADDAPFVVTPLDRGSIVKTVAATGTVEPLVKVIVGSEVSGKIKKWYTDFNAVVKAGDVLAEIDPDSFKTALAQAQANLDTARAREEELAVRLRQARHERERIENLFKLNNASEQELFLTKIEEDAAEAAWHGAQASVASAQALLDSAKVDLERTIIRSPIDGVVIARNIEDGQTVAASLQAPELFVIANDLSLMQVNANVAEADIGLISEGRPATFRVDAYPNRAFNGTIAQIRYNASVVEGVVTYVTLIQAANKDLALRPGMTANVTFEVARADDVIKIPNSALRFDPNPPAVTSSFAPRNVEPTTPTVYVLSNGRPEKREIQIGISNGMHSALVSGSLKEGDAVITERNWRAAMSGGRPDVTRSLRRGM